MALCVGGTLIANPQYCPMSQYLKVSGPRQKLKESEKVKDDFVRIAAHELRTPIQPILGLTQILRSRIKDNQQQQFLDTILRNAKDSKDLPKIF